ncbi:MAG: aminodeoxychorismate/anthranilate synthase component II [Planctomycetota bacterium]
MDPSRGLASIAPLDILLLDNRDSFVWNLAQMFLARGHAVDVVRSDAIDAASIARRRPAALVISPGPGAPREAGSSIDAIAMLTGAVPILGVCLGHQALGAAFGARIERTAPCHGKVRPLHHRGGGLFRGLPERLSVCRYHSLCVAPDSLPADLCIDAWSDDEVVMALRHRRHPVFGLQFHPESFRTEVGDALIDRFLEFAA